MTMKICQIILQKRNGGELGIPFMNGNLHLEHTARQLPKNHQSGLTDIEAGVLDLCRLENQTMK